MWGCRHHHPAPPPLIALSPKLFPARRRRHRDDRLTQASRHWRPPSHTTKPPRRQPCPAHPGVHYYRPRHRLTSAAPPSLRHPPPDPRDAAEASSPRGRPARPAMALAAAGPMHTMDTDADTSAARAPALLDPPAPPHSRRVPPHRARPPPRRRRRPRLHPVLEEAEVRPVSKHRRRVVREAPPGHRPEVPVE